MLAISAGTAGGAGTAGTLIKLGDTNIAPRIIDVALANPGAEAGDISGWTTTGTWEAGTAEGTIAAPQAPTLNPRESAHCRVEVDFPASPTDGAVISIYGSLDGTAWSATPLMVLVLDKDVDPNSIDFIVTAVYQFRVGVKRSGSTDTLASADLAFRKDCVSV